MRTPLFIFKVARYEYWPWIAFYLPLLPYWIYLSIRSRSLAYFSVANPGIELGGFYGESKSGILSMIDKQYLPKSVFVQRTDTFETLRTELAFLNISYPVIAKPDVGERGNDVRKIENENDLKTYHALAGFNYLIQEFIDYELEFGVLYSRLPGSDKGTVSSVTLKEFLTVTGDGQSSIYELMQKSVRARFQLKRLATDMGKAIRRIPAAGETVLLEPIGNHCRGTRFINYNHIINARLHEIFDAISLPIEGFYYGRFDLKVKSLDDLQNGTTIKIMELNGASSEPGHIYDSRYSLLKAYRDLTQHWKRLADISTVNMKNGLKPVSFTVIVKTWLKFVLLKK